ncbi:DUF998 domain-containing protein [Streptomyces sp. NPDC005562]|uniref:DUF998 domain-containing protein n=1 Tax=Streptomyces sp. NPDC005562 TaxID=3154890 RepID=UPI0033BBB6C6
MRTDLMTAGRPAQPAGGRRSATVRRTAVAALVAGGLLYNAWVLEWAVPTSLDPRHSYISELYAEHQPYRELFAGFEFTCGVLVLIGALAARRCTPRSLPPSAARAQRCGWWMLAGFAAASLGDVLWPMACAPSLDPACRPVHPAHTITSALCHFFLFASFAAHTWAARHRKDAPGGPVATWGWWLAGAALLSALGTVGALLGHPGWHGVPQRVHVLLVGVWLVLLASYAARPAAPAPAPPDAGDPPVVRTGAGAPQAP